MRYWFLFLLRFLLFLRFLLRYWCYSLLSNGMLLANGRLNYSRIVEWYANSNSRLLRLLIYSTRPAHLLLINSSLTPLRFTKTYSSLTPLRFTKLSRYSVSIQTLTLPCIFYKGTRDLTLWHSLYIYKVEFFFIYKVEFFATILFLLVIKLLWDFHTGFHEIFLRGH